MKKKQSLTLVFFTLAILVSISVETVQALTISVSGQGLPVAQGAEATFLAGVSGAVTESFEGLSASNPSVKPLFYVTSVGTFTQITAGHGGACEATTCPGLTQIL